MFTIKFYAIMRYLDFVSQLMHPSEAVPFRWANRKYATEIHSTTPALEFCLFSAHDTVAGTHWHFYWLIVVERSWLHWSTFQLKIMKG